MPVLLWLGMRAEADAAEAARVHRRPVELARADELLAAFPGGGAGVLAYRALAEAERARAAGTPLAGRGAPRRIASTLWASPTRPPTRACGRRTRCSRAAATGVSRPRDWPRAHGTAVALGAEPLREDVEALARRARISPLQGAAPSAEPAEGLLTRREADVLELLADGLTNREIASRLFISEKTVSTHIGHIYDKLGVHSRVEAAGRARAIGNT